MPHARYKVTCLTEDRNNIHRQSFSMASSDSENSLRTASSGYSDREYESASTSNDGNMTQLQPYTFNPRRAVAEREMACAEDSEDDMMTISQI